MHLLQAIVSNSQGMMGRWQQRLSHDSKLKILLMFEMAIFHLMFHRRDRIRQTAPASIDESPAVVMTRRPRT